MSMDDLERGLRLVADHSDRARFVGPRDDGVIAAAEQELGLRFPATYRRFLAELGAGSLRGREFYGVIDTDWGPSPPDAVGITRDERGASSLPERYVVVGETGDGDWYAVDCEDEAVYVVMPGVDPEEAGPPERVAADFGAFFAERVSAAVG